MEHLTLVDVLVQAQIACTGLVAVVLSQSGNPDHRRYAPVFGLMGQPFWLYATWSAGQPGMFVLSLAYAAAWGAGFWQHWMRRR